MSHTAFQAYNIYTRHGFYAPAPFMHKFEAQSVQAQSGALFHKMTKIHILLVSHTMKHLLKAYSLIPYSGCSLKFQNFPKGIQQKSFIYEIRAIFS